MRLRIFSTDDYRSQYQALATVDSFTSPEMRVRLLLLTLAVAASYFAFEFIYPLAWLVLYCFLLWLQQVLALRVKRRPNRMAFWRLAVLNFFVALVFIALPMALWFTGNDLLRAGAIGLSAGAVLHSFALRARMPMFAMGDAIANSMFIAVIGTSVYMQQQGTFERVIVVLMFIGMIFYYFSALVSVFRVRSALHEATLRSGEAQKMNAVGQLTRGVAHDFNNILTVVLGNLELYHEVEDRNDKDRLAQEARVAAERASQLTAQLVAFARQSTLVPVSVNLSVFLHQFAQMVDRVIPAKVDFKSTVPRGVPNIRVDKSLFEMALLNLVLNARDAMPDGGRLRITAQPLKVASTSRFALNEGLPTGDYVQVMVSDTGVGIPILIQSQVFEPFFTTKNVGDGSGLGLSMAKGFAQQSSGALLMDSRPGVGTIFSIVLPVVEAPEQVTSNATSQVFFAGQNSETTA